MRDADEEPMGQAVFEIRYLLVYPSSLRSRYIEWCWKMQVDYARTLNMTSWGSYTRTSGWYARIHK